MSYLTTITLIFAIVLIAVEVVDSNGQDLATRPISHYFSTGTAVVQDVAFALMAFAIWYAAWEVWQSWASLSFFFVGVGLLLAMTTDTFPSIYGAWKERLHYTGAALCFLAGLSMMLAAASYLYALAYVCGALLLFAIDREHTAVQEKVGVMMLAVWVFGYSLGIA